MKSSSFSRAFTLVEILVVVGVLSIIGGVAYESVSGIPETSRVSKLNSDTTAINDAITLYRLNGGADFPADATPATILTALKAKANADSSAHAPAASGSFIDPRLTVSAQTAAEASSSQARARWNATTQHFEVVTTGASGVKEFIFGTAETPAAVSRSVGRTVADSGWVWDKGNFTTTATTYTGASPTGGTDMVTGNITGTSLAKLSAPTFSPGGGAAALTLFQPTRNITITNPNGAGAIYYSTPSQTRVLYAGPVAVTPGATLTAWVESTNPAQWLNSEISSATYTATAVPLVVTWSAPASLTYDQASGVAILGDYMGSPLVPIVIALSYHTANLSATASGVHSSFLGSGYSIKYTTDGSDPQSSGTATTVSGNGTTAVPITESAFGAASSLSLRAIAISSSNYFTNSPEATASVAAATTPLADPFISPTGAVISTNQTITITPDPGNPGNSLIYYTTNGTTPSATNGTLYTAPFNLPVPNFGTATTVQAVAVAEAGYENWFSQSGVSSELFSGMNFNYAGVDGVLIGGGTIANNAALNGSVVIASMPGQQPNVIVNNNAIIQGDIYAPGTPTVIGITANKVINLDGAESPSNYSITINNNAVVGNVYRRITPVYLPTVALPTGLVNRGNATATGTLLSGNYTKVTSTNGAVFTLGVAGSTTPTVYRINALTLGNGARINIVGPVIITLNPASSGTTIDISNNAIFGNSAHPEWLQVNLYKGNIKIGNNGYFYGSIMDPTGTVTFDNNSYFNGGVTAKTLSINNNGAGLVFSLPPPTN